MNVQDALKLFNKYYNDTYEYVLKYVVCKCLNMADIEDIMQEIYLSIYKVILKGKEINKSYIMGIASKKVNDYYRFKYKDKLISLFSKDNEIDNIKSDIDIEKCMLIKYDTELVWRFYIYDILLFIKVIVFKIFYLYYKSGLKIKDIANELDITEMNVKNYLYRTLHELNAYLENEGDENEQEDL